MSKIDCAVTNCSHNNETTCYANVINVGGKSADTNRDTCCASFLDSASYGHLTSNVNQGGSECISITCNVGTCTYNTNSVCLADSIQVGGENVNLYTETDCKTFKAE